MSGSDLGMLSTEDILIIVGAAAGIWAVGFSWGKCVSWLRELKNAA
jgi:flagellar motor component MotA